MAGWLWGGLLGADPRPLCQPLPLCSLEDVFGDGANPVCMTRIKSGAPVAILLWPAFFLMTRGEGPDAPQAELRQELPLLGLAEARPSRGASVGRG